MILYISGEWVFGDVLCRIVEFSIEVCLAVSMFSLTLVAMERYFLICRTNPTSRNRRTTLRMCGGVWITAIVVCFPYLYGYSTENVTIMKPRNDSFYNTTIKTCVGMNWPDSMPTGLWYFIHASLVYAIPFPIVIVVHSLIIRHINQKRKRVNLNAAKHETRETTLKIAESPAEIENDAASPTGMMSENSKSTYVRKVQAIQQVKNARAAARNFKISKLLICITAWFFFCWTPWVVLRLIRRFLGAEWAMTRKSGRPQVGRLSSTIWYWIWTTAQVLLLLSTVPNFFITLLMSSEFRKTVKVVFSGIRQSGISLR